MKTANSADARTWPFKCKLQCCHYTRYVDPASIYCERLPVRICSMHPSCMFNSLLLVYYTFYDTAQINVPSLHTHLERDDEQRDKEVAWQVSYSFVLEYNVDRERGNLPWTYAVCRSHSEAIYHWVWQNCVLKIIHTKKPSSLIFFSISC